MTQKWAFTLGSRGSVWARSLQKQGKKREERGGERRAEGGGYMPSLEHWMAHLLCQSKLGWLGLALLLLRQGKEREGKGRGEAGIVQVS